MIDTGISNGSSVDRSGTATTSNAVIATNNPYRKWFIIQNQDVTNSIFVNFGSPATAGPGSWKIVPGEKFTLGVDYVDVNAINIISSAGTAAFTAKEGS